MWLRGKRRFDLCIQLVIDLRFVSIDQSGIILKTRKFSSTYITLYFNNDPDHYDCVL